MPVRHVVAASNVDAADLIIDPGRARHCVIAAGRLLDLSGEVDPLTHLNLDFHDHSLGDCVVADELERGARVCLAGDGRLLLAATPPASLAHLGHVDIDTRRIAWLSLLRDRRATRSPVHG